MPGEFEERMKVVLKELTETPGKYILFIDDIHTVTGPNAQQGGGVMDASVLLKPLLRCEGCGEWERGWRCGVHAWRRDSFIGPWAQTSTAQAHGTLLREGTSYRMLALPIQGVDNGISPCPLCFMSCSVLCSRGELRCIGATTLDKYRKFIEKDPALERRFQQVWGSAGGWREIKVHWCHDP